MLFSSLVSLALVASAPVTLGFSDKKAHELSRSRARSHYAKARNANQNNSTGVVERDVDVNVDVSLEKRATYNGRATYYAVGLGACGWHNVASDFIVAQNSAQYGGGYPGPNCGRSITISYGGKQVSATIADECPTCDYGGLDLSEGLFTQFADTGAGVFYMSWWYNDESQSQPTTTSSSSPSPTPTSTYTPPTSTYVEPSTTPTPTSTYVEPSTSAAAAPTSSSSSVAASSIVEASTTVSASLASNSSTTLADPDFFQTNATVPANVNATSTASADEAQATVAIDASFGNLVMFNQAVANLGHIVVVGAEK
ncbi:hypothetical protein IAU59_005814 [Kwoniella sp. CBS 9459]